MGLEDHILEAAKKGGVELRRYLRETKKIRKTDLETAFISAISEGSYTAVACMLEFRPKLADCKGNNYHSASVPTTTKVTSQNSSSKRRKVRQKTQPSHSPSSTESEKANKLKTSSMQESNSTRKMYTSAPAGP